MSLARQAHLYSLVRKEEILRVRRICCEVKVNLLQRLKSSRGELGSIEHQVKDIAVFEAVDHPPANELTNILDVDLFDNVALDANELSDRRVLVVESVEPVKLKEIVKARSVYLSLRFAVFIGVLHPELRRHGHLQKVAEVFSLAMNLKPIAQILARFATIVFVGLQFVRKPRRMYIDEAQGELTPLAFAGLVDVGYVVEHLDILHNLLVLVSRELISLTIEP